MILSAALPAKYAGQFSSAVSSDIYILEVKISVREPGIATEYLSLPRCLSEENYGNSSQM
jgi:hypothetical protein